MTGDRPPRKGPPPEPTLPRLLSLEIGAPPDRRKRAVGLPLLGVALVLGVLTATGVVGVGVIIHTTRPSAPRPPIPSGRVAPGTPPSPVVDPVVPPEPVAPVIQQVAPPRPRPAKVDPVLPGTPGRLVVEGEAVVELQGEFGGFRPGTPLPPGDYTIWADFGDGLVDTGVRATAAPGRAVTVVCVVEHRMCAIMP